MRNVYSDCFVVCLLLVVVRMVSLAEGTKELRPTAASFGKIKLVNTIPPLPTPRIKFACYGGLVDFRLNVHICDLTEKIYMGFQASEDIDIRVVAPNGNVVFASRPIPTAGAGFIANYNQAVAGPNTVNAGGYQPFVVTPTVLGDYSVEFDYQGNDDGASVVDLFDVTVVDASNKIRPGRLWSKAWDVATENGNRPFIGSFYVYTLDQIVTKVDMNGIQPNEFIFSANNRGTTNAGSPVDARKSKRGVNQTFPQYQIFLNDPDSTCYPSGQIGAIVGNPMLTGCPGSYCVKMQVTAPGEALIVLDLNGTPGYQDGSKDRLLIQTLVKGENCVIWDGKDGEGVDFNETATISVNVKYVNGITNIPMYDVENNANGYVVTYVRPSSSASKIVNLFWDDTNIPGGTANTLPCTGPCHNWPNGFGDVNTINTWWYISDSDADLVLNLKRSIDANRNTVGTGKANDTSICASEKNVLLKGSLEGFPKSIWTKIGGTGTFDNDSSLTTVYRLSSADSLRSSISLVLSSVGGTCPPLKDTITILVHPLPTVSAASNKAEVCKGDQIVLTGSGASSYNWSNSVSNGVSFTPSATTTYLVTGTDVNFCTNTDTVTVKVNELPVVVASVDTDTICKGDMVTLTGGGSAVSFTWSPTGSNGTPFSPPASATYTVTGTDANNCKNTDSIDIVVNPCLKCNKPLAVRVSAPQSGCESQALDFAGEYEDAGTSPVSGSMSFVWYKSGANVQPADYQSTSGTGVVQVPTKIFTSLSSTDSGVYVLRVQDGTDPLDAQCYTEAKVRVVVDQAPTEGILIGPTSLCEDQDSVFVLKDVKSSLQLTYAWSSGTGGASYMASEDSLGRYRFASDGTITTGGLSVEATNKCGSKIFPYTVSINLKPRASLDTIVGPLEFCESVPSVTYSIAPQPNVTAYSWYWDNDLQVSQTSSVVIRNAQWVGSTKPLVKVVPKNACGEGTAIERQVAIIAAKTSAVNLLSDKVRFCRPLDNVLFTTSVQNVASGAQYTFYVDNIIQQGPSTEASYNAPIGLLSDNSQVYVEVNQTGCYTNPTPKSNTITVDSYEIPDPSIHVVNGKTRICEVGEGPIQLAAMPSKGARFEWYKGLVKVSTSSSITLSLPQQSGDYELVINNAVCPPRNSDTSVKIFEMPQITFVENPKVVKFEYEGQKSFIDVTNTGLALDEMTYVKWHPEMNLSKADTLEPYFLAQNREEVFNYFITVKTGDSLAGCTSVTPYEVINTLDIRVPNAFSPNGDGRNDTWVIDGMLKYPNSKVSVFNRWGNTVYVDNNGYKVPWDGNHSGNDLPSATYYYVIDLKGSVDQTDHPITGSLTIVR